MRKFFDELRTNLPDSSKDQYETVLSNGLNQRINPIESEQPGQLNSWPKIASNVIVIAVKGYEIRYASNSQTSSSHLANIY